jgi:hypothetical protein
MNTERWAAVICLCTASLLIARCAPGQILGPALTPTPTSTLTPTPTLTPTVTPSETPIPGAIITGRVYLMDRNVVDP